jgi:hypothetical protein
MDTTKSVHTTISTFGRSSPFVLRKHLCTLNEMREVSSSSNIGGAQDIQFHSLGTSKKERKKERQVGGGC